MAAILNVLHMLIMYCSLKKNFEVNTCLLIAQSLIKDPQVKPAGGGSSCISLEALQSSLKADALEADS